MSTPHQHDWIDEVSLHDVTSDEWATMSDDKKRLILFGVEDNKDDIVYDSWEDFFLS